MVPVSLFEHFGESAIHCSTELVQIERDLTEKNNKYTTLVVD